MTPDLKTRVMGILGWITLGEAEILEHFARDQNVLEIGSFMGRSTVAMAPVAKKIICIDYFQIGYNDWGYDETKRILPPEKKPDTRAIFERNVKPWRHKIEVHEMHTFDAVKLDWEPVGLLFIDGGHDYATVLNDCGFLKWVIVGGHVLFHDTGWTGVWKAVCELVLDNPKWQRVEWERRNMTAFRRLV